MVAAGLPDEVQALQEAGYKRRLPAMSGLGYRQLVDYLAGKSTLTEAVERIKTETHRFVRQQYTWFRPGDPQIQWLDIEESDVTARATRLVRRWLAGLERDARAP